jgi:hypothetical protein
MKKLYFLDEDEKSRILNLHESATKKQYLPEASFGSSGWVSVSYTNFSLTLNNYLEMERRGSGSELKLFKGTVFSKENADTIVTKPNTTYQLVGDYTGGVEEDGKGKIRYYCKTKEFAIEGRNAKFWGEDFQDDVQKAFDALCDELPNASKDTQKAGGQSEVEKNAISCGWKKQDGTADVEGYKNAKWQCPKPGTTKTKINKVKTNTVVKPVIPSDADLDAVYAKL